MSLFVMKSRLAIPVARRMMGSLAHESFGNPLSVLAMNSASNDTLLPSDNKDLTIKISSSYILPEDLRRINGLSFYPNYGKNKGIKIGGSSAIGQVKSSKKSDIAVGDQVYVLSNGTWCDTINVSSSDVIKLPNTIKPEDVAALPSLVSAYTLLNNYKSKKIYQLNGDSAYGKDLTVVGKALGVEIVNVTIADLEKVTDLNLLFAPTSAIQNNKSVTKSLGLNGKIVVYNDTSSAAAASGALDIPVATQIFKVSSITGYDYHIWALNNQSQHTQNVHAVVKLIADKKINGANGAKIVPLSEYKTGITSALTGASGIVLKF